MIKLHCLKKGKGTPLVFLHGFLGTSEDWTAVVSHLNGKTCFAIDLPGHGKSPFTEHFFDCFPSFLEKIHLIGYSMGGRLAAQYANRFPEKLAKLTLLSTHPGLKTKEERAKRYAHDQMWHEKLLSLPFDLFLQMWYAQGLFGGFVPDLRVRLRQDREALAKTYLHYGLANMPSLHLDRPVLIGERDLKFRALYGENCTLIEGAAHMIHLENPKQVASLL